MKTLKHSLDKLKNKLELQPKFVAKQQKFVTMPIFIFDLNNDIEPSYVVSVCKKYQTSTFKETKHESVYAWRSDYHSISNNKMPEFKNLFDVVENKIGSIWSHIEPLVLHHFWFAIYQTGDSADVHDHGWADLACVYYASVPEGSAPLIIPSNDVDVEIQPKNGTLVVMPGLCSHRVPKSLHQNGERIIVAINVARKGTANFVDK